MKLIDKKINLKRRAVSWCCALMMAGIIPSVFSSETATITFTTTIVATCSLSTPATVDLGNIPFSAFRGLSSQDELWEYDSSLVISTSCSGSDKYTLKVTPSRALYNCLIASTTSGGMGFCFYDENNDKVLLSTSGTTLERDSGTDVTLKVVPMRTGVPATGTHSGTLTITISPL